MMESSKHILTTKKLSVGYKNKLLVGDINVVFERGQLIALMGLNGTGKTSFFKTILREIPVLAGGVFIGDKSIEDIQIQDFVSVVYTDKIDVFGLTVYDVIGLGRLNKLSWLGKLTPSDEEVINKYVDLLDLKEIKNQQINSLSDGQFQKVMIGRALAQDTPIILLDEPTAFLDVKNKKTINNLLKELSIKENKTIIVSAHDIDFANKFCDKTLLIKNKKIENYGCNEVKEELFD